MKITRPSFVIALLVAFILGFFGGMAYKDRFDNGGVNEFSPIAFGCKYEGKNYKSGDSFRSSDGCNSCSCSQGQVACTLMACLPD